MVAYLDKLKYSYGQRGQITLPPVRRFIIILNVLLVVFIILTLKFSPKDSVAFHFREEKGVLTAFSAIFLAIASGLAGSSYYLSDKESKSKRVFWLLNMFGFGYFALDELMQWHEKLGEWLGDFLIGQAQIFRNWNDFIVILYGIAALIFLAFFLPAILSYPKFIEVLAIAFVFYIIHTAIDSLVVDRIRQSSILEETCKLFSSANFACAMFIGLLGNVMVYCSSRVNR